MTALANGCPQQLADTLVGRSQVVCPEPGSGHTVRSLDPYPIVTV
jgi:hypothetical protein